MSIPIFSWNPRSENVEPMQMDALIDDVDVYETSDSSSSENLNSHVVESAPFEVESYASQFSGYGKLIRLMYIAEHCPPLQIDALEQAMKYVKQTFNVQMYKKIHEKLMNIDHANVEPLDREWIDRQNDAAQFIFDKLETDLKNYKTNSIKESIRRAHDDLGTHYLACGDLNNALKCYIRSKDYCMGDNHLFTICLNVIKLNIYLQNWNNVNSYIQKAESTKMSSSNAEYANKINCFNGLLDMVTKNYKAAAERFVKTNFDEFGQNFTDIMSLNNITIYAGLCALATFDRDELRKKVLNCSKFRQFLELEPQLRDAMTRFWESKYPDCLKLLDELRDAFLLDIYLAPHVKTLYSMIRNRALIQYFTPFLSADLNLMAREFNTTLASLEEELIRLILDGQIQARIDSHNKVLYVKDTDPRLLTFEIVLENGKKWQMNTRYLLIKAACARNGMITIRECKGNSPPVFQSNQMTPPQSTTTSSSNNNQQKMQTSITTASTASNESINECSSPSFQTNNITNTILQATNNPQRDHQVPSSPGNPLISPSSPPSTNNKDN